MRLLAFMPFVVLTSFVFTSPTDLGPTYENKEFGFSLKPIKDWNAVPPQPRDKYKVVSWLAKQVEVARKVDVSHTPTITVWAFKIDATDGLSDAQRKKMSAKEIAEYTPARSYAEFFSQCSADWNLMKVGEPKKRDFGGRTVTVWTLSSTNGRPAPERDTVYVFTESNIEIAIACDCLDEWHDTLANDFESVARSFKFSDKAEAAKPAAATTPNTGTNPAENSGATTKESPDVRQKRFLDEQIAKLPPGWKHFMSKKNRYLFVYDAEEEFVRKLAVHVEAMRDYYETVFVPPKPITMVSIVRVCKDRNVYLGYGAPENTGGYWSPSHRELVIYQNKESDQNWTWGVITHEAFHQYVYCFHGRLYPHRWFDEGYGDYFAGAVMSASGEKVLEVKPFKPFEEEAKIKEAIREKTWTPFQKFFAMGWDDFYAGDKSRNYAQAWSIIYFLRNGRKAGAKVDPKWASVLDLYLESLVKARQELAAVRKDDGYNESMEEEARSKARVATFGSWTKEDFATFEAAWKKFYGG